MPGKTKWNRKPTNTTANHMEFFLCLPELWSIQTMTRHCRTLIFPVASWYQFQRASWLEAGLHVCSPFSVLEPHLPGTCIGHVYGATVSVRSHVWQSYYLEETISLESPTTSGSYHLSASFPTEIPESWEEGLDKDIPTMSAPKPLIFCTSSSCVSPC